MTNGTYHGDDVLRVGRPVHVTETAARADVAYVMSDENTDGREITDSVAVTIASWFAGHRRGDGLAMAELSTSGTVRLEDLADDASALFSDSNTTSEDFHALGCLMTWALNHDDRL